ncbi:MAG: DUF853 family protein [Polyangiaceae bacterium]
MSAPSLFLGATRPLNGNGNGQALTMFGLPAHHLVTHSVIVGATGSGKTGLVTVMVEEALRNGIPVLMIDVKGDLPNLLLSFPTFSPAPFIPWMEGSASPLDSRSIEQLAQEAAELRQQGLTGWGITEADLIRFREQSTFRVITPGATSGEPLHMLSGLERPSQRWKSDPEGARDALSAAVSLVLRLLGRDPDPARSREHVLLMVLAEARLSEGEPADLATLLEALVSPPIDKVGALSVDAFMPKSERKALAASVNSLLASPSFSLWREGVTLDVADWLKPVNKRAPGVIVSVAHLDDSERALVLGVVLEEVLTWVRSLPGTQRLRALIVFDEVYGFMPPHPANPPTKRPLVSLMKQARAFGVGVVVATQNPMDLDYRALGNAGLWCVGRLQTDNDRERVLDGITASGPALSMKASELENVVKRLSLRWFVMRNVHANPGLCFLQPRWAMSYLRGPMTRNEIRMARESAEVAVCATSPTILSVAK